MNPLMWSDATIKIMIIINLFISTQFITTAAREKYYIFVFVWFFFPTSRPE